MSYHHLGQSISDIIPPPPTKAQIARDVALTRGLDARIKRGQPVTREQVLYMFEHAPVRGCFGGPVPKYPVGVKEAVTRMRPGATVPNEWVQRAYTWFGMPLGV